MASVCDPNIMSSCRSRENDSVFSSKSSLVIVTLKHSLRGPEVGDPGLLGNTKETVRNSVNPVKSLPAPKCYIIMIVMHKLK